ncbi:hypothetical protein [Nitrincola iocasae]|uniref:hypothetical protein n=1 Tax=Nitrincola iocasae TaxID=2614693 RepID=UPI0017802F0A|nr:hypothetical protein [Nitrincola iocasae]
MRFQGHTTAVKAVEPIKTLATRLDLLAQCHQWRPASKRLQSLLHTADSLTTP